jgi:hypothetical protein
MGRLAAREPHVGRVRSLAAHGVGPLYQRDYWAVVDDCTLAPSQVGALLAEHFWELSPPELARFERADGTARPLEVGDDMLVHIRFAGTFGVRVVHRDSNSITVGTLQGHPEAGRITFGAYRNDGGDVIFHIRSRARTSSGVRFAEFVTLGEAMQTNTWMDFVERVAATIGAGVRGSIHEETNERLEDDEDEARPTFVAQGD